MNRKVQEYLLNSRENSISHVLLDQHWKTILLDEFDVSQPLDSLDRCLCSMCSRRSLDEK